MKQTTIIALVLAVLVLVSAVQAFQLNTLKTKISEGKVSIGSGKSATPLTSSGSSSGPPSGVPQSVSDLPQMVGGC